MKDLLKIVFLFPRKTNMKKKKKAKIPHYWKNSMQVNKNDKDLVQQKTTIIKNDELQIYSHTFCL